MKILFAVLSVIIGLSAFGTYIKDIFLKRTKPHAYTWLIWALTQGTATAGLLYGNGGLGAIELVIGTMLVLVVFVFSLRHGTKNITKSDTAVLILALLAIFVWWQLHNPVAAVLMVSAIDAFGYIPSFRKSWQDPWSETLLSWGLFSVGNLCSLAALTEYNLLTVTYLITISSFNIMLMILCLLRRRKVARLITP